MPGRGMSFILYVVVLVVSVTSVMMGLDWLSTPPPPLPKSVQTVPAPAKPAATAASKQITSTESAAKQTAATTGKATPTTVAKVETTKQPEAAAPETAGSAPVSTIDDTQANTPDNATRIMADEGDASGTTAQANASPPRCDVQACTQRYRSFNAADCTFQPFEGPRRLCTVGNPPRQASEKPASVQTSDSSRPPASPSCNIQACADAYRSFDPATCTWQPFEGPRRLCEK